jgi:arginase
MDIPYNIEILSAPSTLGLRSDGVELLAETLLRAGLAQRLQVAHPVVQVPTLNEFRSKERDAATRCLNPHLIHKFSLDLGKTVTQTLDKQRFALVLGGDCSLLVGIMPALKVRGSYGLIFIDAHADFYSPEASTSGEAADMDLAIVTGRGPTLLTNINDKQPYVADQHVVHIGQRDWEETKHYGSPDIRDTAIRCFDLALIEEKGIVAIAAEVLEHIDSLPVDGYWIHFDTDVLSDDINPAVDYRLPDGLSFEQASYLMRHLLQTGRIAGMSITIYNPALDKTGTVAKGIIGCLAQLFNE